MIKLLCFLLGLDKDILKSNEGRDEVVLILTIIYVLVISLCVYGCYYAGYLITNNIFSASIISVFLTYILHNMYRLIIATSHQGSQLKTKKEKYKYISIKGFLVIVIAIFISSSLCVKIFDSKIDVELNEYKSNLVQDYEVLLENTYGNQIAELIKSYKEEKELNTLINKKFNGSDTLVLQTNIDEIQQLRQTKIENFNSAILDSSFFIRRVTIISGHLIFWVTSILIILFFLVPLYIFNQSNYFLNYQSIRKNINNKLVLQEYNNFKNSYENLISSSAGKQISLEERYEDPPFNTIRIERSEIILKKGSLLEWIKKYHG